METKYYNTARILIWGVYPVVLFIVITCMFLTCSNKGLRAQNESVQTENTAR